jgi:hypothetical protein
LNYSKKTIKLLKQEIKISVLSIDEGDNTMHFKMEVSNGIITASQDFYGYADIFKEFANRLLIFPNTISDKIKFEHGEKGNRWAYYILMEVFCYDKNGHSVIHVITDNNSNEPNTNKSEFYIKTVPASLNKLGQTLSHWNPMTEKDIKWMAE